MAKRRPMSKTETEVARLLWELGRATAREVHAALERRKRHMDFSTVQTYLHRLEEKGYVSARIEGRAKSYIAKVAPGNVIREAVDDFVKRLFDGNSFPLLQHLIAERGIKQDEVAKLRELLDGLDAEQRK